MREKLIDSFQHVIDIHRRRENVFLDMYSLTLQRWHALLMELWCLKDCLLCSLQTPMNDNTIFTSSGRNIRICNQLYNKTHFHFIQNQFSFSNLLYTTLYFLCCLLAFVLFSNVNTELSLVFKINNIHSQLIMSPSFIFESKIETVGVLVCWVIYCGKYWSIYVIG